VAISRLKTIILSLIVLFLAAGTVHASEADLAIPDLHAGHFDVFGARISAWWLLFCGAMVICGTLGISLYLRTQIHKLPAHKSMLDVAEVIFQTCKTYLIQQGKFLLMLFVLIAIAISYYLLGFGHDDKHELTYRTIQELKSKKVDDKEVDPDVLTRMAALLPIREKVKQAATESKSKAEADKKVDELNIEAVKNPKIDDDKKLAKADFLKAIEKTLTPEQWSKYKGTIEEVATPTLMAPVMQVVFVLLFSVVGIAVK